MSNQVPEEKVNGNFDSLSSLEDAKTIQKIFLSGLDDLLNSKDPLITAIFKSKSQKYTLKFHGLATQQKLTTSRQLLFNLEAPKKSFQMCVKFSPTYTSEKKT